MSSEYNAEYNAPAEKLSTVESLVRANPEIVGFQNYEYFRNNNAGQKELFIDGSIESLGLDYPELQSGSIYELAEQTKLALVTMMPGEDSDKTKALYEAIEYRYAEMFLVSLATEMQSGLLDDADYAEVVEQFKIASEALYGKPEARIFNALADKRIGKVLDKEQSAGTVAKEISDELRQLIGVIEETDYRPYAPEEQTISRLSDLVNEKFGRVIEHIDPDKTYQTADMVEALSEVMDKLGGDELGWQVVIAPNSASLSTSPHQRLVEVGENRKPLSGDNLRALAMHECGVHALRSINAEQAGWLSAAYGQDGYLAFEEALATALEDAYKGAFKDHGADYYLIAGLAYGLDEHEPRDFREVYEIMWRVNALDSASTGDIAEEQQIDKAKAKAFNACVRMFRGTSTVDKGVVYLKDLAYFTGQELAWSILDDVHTQEDFELLLAGKLDLTREDHVKVAKQIIEQNKQAK